MKKPAKYSFLLVPIVIVMIWAPLYPVLAQESTPSASTHPGLKLNQDIGHTVVDHRDNILQKIQQIRTKIATREAELKDRLLKFKDQKNATIAQRVSENLNKINKNRTDAMGKHLDVLSDVLGKVEQRASGSASSSASIASASAAITVARTAVDAQSQKDYTISATSEATLRSEVQTKRNQLFTDLTGVRKLILDARQALVDAIRTTANKGNN